MSDTERLDYRKRELSRYMGESAKPDLRDARIAQLEAELKVAREALERIRDETAPFPGIRLITTIARMALGELAEIDAHPISNALGKVCKGEYAALKEGQDTTPATGGGEAS